ncbi:MAG: anti-sigma B factor antagonist [Planctomycetota bacterium]|jgi:anti-sigma B factor antagonist
MHITAEPRDNYTILHLRGEFDTFYCPHLHKEVESLIAAGTTRVAINLRLVKFINSTALGAIIKASKTLTAAGGKLTIARPSRFCADIIQKVGLDRVVPMFESDEAAGAALLEGANEGEIRSGELKEEEEGAVMFSPLDNSRVEHFVPEEHRGGGKANPVHGHSFGKSWRGIGKMNDLSADGLRFSWSGGTTGMSPFEISQFLAIGTDLKVKFRLPLLQKGHCEAEVTVTEIDERENSVKIGASFKSIDKETSQAVEQYATDMAFLKSELKQATDS